MRADRLISMVLLLRRRGQLSVEVLADALEVSTRTVQRDFEALSAAGVPIYAERGRHGGYALLPGFRTELTGLHDDEALALLTAVQGSGDRLLGLGPALGAAMRKVVDALPDRQRADIDDAAGRLLIEPATDLLSRPRNAEIVPEAVLVAVRGAVLGGRQLRIRYAAVDRAARWRTVDPVGLVTVRGQGYLLALVDGADRTYRLSRILEAQQLTEAARRPDTVDLERLWRERSEQFRTGGDRIRVQLLVAPQRQDELRATVLAVHTEGAEPDGRLRWTVSFQDSRHAEWALWQLGLDAQVVEPAALRMALHDRAAALAAHHRRSEEVEGAEQGQHHRRQPEADEGGQETTDQRCGEHHSDPPRRR